MRAVSRLFTVLAAALCLVLLACLIGWLGRHHWVPVVVNQQLEGFVLSGLRGLTLSHEKDQISAHIEHLTLDSKAGLRIDIADMQLIDLRAILRKMASDDPAAPVEGQLRVGKVALQSAKTARPGITTPNSARPAAESSPQGSTSQNSDRTVTENGDSVGTATGKVPVSIGQALSALREIPFRKLEIEQLHWTGNVDGYLTVSAGNAPGQKITGEVRSSRCKSCAIHLSLNNDEPQAADIQLQLNQNNHPIAKFEGNLTRNNSGKVSQAPDTWTLKSQFLLTSRELEPLSKSLGFSLTPKTADANTTDWYSLVHAMDGQIELSFSGEAPDKLEKLADLGNINATLTSSSLSTVLPEQVAGVSLAVRYGSVEPLSFHLSSLTPLVVDSVQGKFSVQVSLAPDSPTPAAPSEPSLPTAPTAPTAQTLVEADVSLATEQSVPSIEFNGHYNLARFQPLLSSARWRNILGQYQIRTLSGEHRFHGSARLPSLKTITDGQVAAVLEALTIQVETNTPARFLLSLPEKENPLAPLGWDQMDTQISTPQPLLLSAKKFPGPMALTMPELDIKVRETSKKKQNKPQPELAGKIIDMSCGQIPAIDCTLTLTAGLNILDMADAATAVEQLSLETQSTIKQADTAKNLMFNFANFNLTARHVTSGPATVAEPELFSQRASCTASPQQTECQIPEMALSIAPLTLEESEVSGVIVLREVDLNNTFGRKHGFNIQGRFLGDNLKVKALSQFEASITSGGRLSLKDGHLSGDSMVSSGPLKMDSQWTHSLETGTGELNIHLPETQFSPENSLARAIQGLPADIVDGALSARVQLSWPDKGHDSALLAMKDTGFQIDESFIVGVNTEVKFKQRGEHWITEQPSQVSVDKVDAGVAISNLHFSLALESNGDLTLNNFAAELLEGVLSADALTWNLNGEERHSQLQFTGISIGALAREMESENFAASGLLDARLPLVTDKQGVTIEDGAIQSRPPGGRLRYYGAFSPAMLGSNPQLKLLAGALEDYNYRDINGTITYPLSGDLKLNLKLTGRSDAIDANRDLIINLNLENNIPTMLRSLQASRDLTDVLEKRVE